MTDIAEFFQLGFLPLSLAQHLILQKDSPWLLFISAIKGYPSLLISNIFSCTSLSLFGGTLLRPANLCRAIYKHRSAMDLPSEAAWPVRRYAVFRCRDFSPLTLYIRERVLRSLESPLSPCIYRIAYFPQKNNRQDIRIPTFDFMLTYKLFLFVLYVLTNYFIVCYNYNVVGNPTEQYRRTFFLQEISCRFSSKTVFSPKRAVKTKTVEKVTNIWYNILAYCRSCFRIK